LKVDGGVRAGYDWAAWCEPGAGTAGRPEMAVFVFLFGKGRAFVNTAREASLQAASSATAAHALIKENPARAAE